MTQDTHGTSQTSTQNAYGLYWRSKYIYKKSQNTVDIMTSGIHSISSNTSITNMHIDEWHEDNI